jgi:alkylated DNA repair dioxygenase AlkB/SAM-dependent methyltransferase
MSKEPMNKFRSVLPHEPLPKEEVLGYLHVQGAFTPPEEEWTRESLETALLNVLKDVSRLGLPHAVQRVEVLDPTPPFTKVRLVYPSTEAAHSVLIVWRRMKLSACCLFDSDRFALRAIQATQITALEHPEIAWNRSNPPKFRRLLPRPGEDVKAIQEERTQTRFVFLSNMILESEHYFWSDPHCIVEALRSVLNEYDSTGLGVEVFIHHKKLTQYCHVGMRTNKDAQSLVANLQETQVTWKYNDNGKVHETESGKLFLDYASITHRSLAKANARFQDEEPVKGEPTRSECTSQTAHVQIPGLFLISDYISEQEEQVLMATLLGPHAPWAPSQATPTGGIVKRKVQHYGYVFDYQTANVLRNRTELGANCPSLPAVPPSNSDLEGYVEDCVKDGDGWNLLAGVVERTRQFNFDARDPLIFPHLNQLTLNQYRPGEGIGSHVDTPSAFGDGLISITLNSGITMEFRHGESKKLIYLPRRSLICMTGDARYKWEHMIVSRTTDTVDGQLIPRGLRVSLTLRTALALDGSNLPRVESTDFPPTWGNSKNNALATPACERDHVHAVYDAIATQWHHTRGKRGVLWPGATEFLKRLPPGSVVADVGCGDGKYFPAIWQAGSYVIGTDISLPLLQTAFGNASSGDEVPETRRVSEHLSHLRDRPAVAVADCMNVPFRTNSCDATICIAVLHHLSTFERRRRCIEELARITRPGGLINIQAWAMDQEETSRRKFAANDVFVPFNAQPKFLTLRENDTKQDGETGTSSKSTAQVYSEAFNADYDDQKGLVVFKRYCHLYKQGELERVVEQVPNVHIVDKGFESGNYFVILEVKA